MKRPLWIQRIQSTWARRPIVWLAGVRRVGKTTLAKALPSARVFNCERFDEAERIDASPEKFFGEQDEAGVLVLDEVHRLADPARVLKIAADEFPGLKVLATGSSTLAAGRKFSDTLTGRKLVVQLTPALWPETQDGFGEGSLESRLLKGGLPPFLLAAERDTEAMAEWLDSYYSRDIQALFQTRQRDGFLKLARLVLLQSGSLADIRSFASESGLSRPSVYSYLEAMKATCFLTALSPFHGGKRGEILKHPKLYAFDTGFACFARGWDTLHPEDLGLLWEHLVLDCIRFSAPQLQIQFWRDKRQREVDFVIPRGRGVVDAIECKIDPDRFKGESLKEFRSIYPQGRNFLVSPRAQGRTPRLPSGLPVLELGARELMQELGASI